MKRNGPSELHGGATPTRGSKATTQAPVGREPPGHPAASTPRVQGTSVTRREFCVAFERCFDRVYAYVERRVEDRSTCERIVEQVLTARIDLLVDPRDDERDLRRLKDTTDRWIALLAVRPGPPGPRLAAREADHDRASDAKGRPSAVRAALGALAAAARSRRKSPRHGLRRRA